MRRTAKVALALWLASPAWAGDWANWRGPHQDGTSTETGLPDRIGDPIQATWTAPIAGRGAPVVHGDALYVWGYKGRGADVVEVLARLDARTGALQWERTFRDYLSDTIYDRYSIGSPVVDPATGAVYVMTTNGVLAGFSPDGAPLWEVPLLEAWGRLTFPNGRTGAPVIARDLVIVHGITSNWGAQGPARDRFMAFDKATGEAVWVSTPGTAPQDSSSSTPVVAADAAGRLVLYAGTGCGHVVAIDAATGRPAWRMPIGKGGVNVAPVLAGRTLVAVHAEENLDSTAAGRMVALDVDAPTRPAEEGAPVLDGERWRAGVASLSSAPVVADGVVYQVVMTGELVALDLATGQQLWSHKLGADQLHASPLYADGKLYVPLHDGTLHVLRPSRGGVEVLDQVQLDGNALGAAVVANGLLYVHTTARLYAFGTYAPTPTPEVPVPTFAPGPAVEARVRPAEVLLRPGERAAVRVDLLDAHGQVVGRAAPSAVTPFIPPGAKVRSEMAAVWKDGALVAAPDAGLTAGAFQVTASGLTGTTRGRTVAGFGYTADFDGHTLTETDPDGAAFTWPPLPWVGARFKWQVRERDGGLVLAKTLDRMLFQRSMVFIGHPDAQDYTLTADVMTDGDRRQMSAVGLINQRYVIAMKANQRVLEVSSNQERLKESVPFVATAGVWYRLRTQVTTGADGVVEVRAKLWPREEPEPADWTITVRHAGGHTRGAPGLFGFTPSNLHRVYIDNVALTRTPGEAP